MQIVFVKNGFYFTGKIKDLSSALRALSKADITISALVQQNLQ